MTNLLATIVITLITNTVETPLDFAPVANQYTVGHAVKKETITIVRELQTCRFEWAGKVREIHESRIVSEERKVLKLEWVTVKLEPPMPQQVFAMVTTTNLGWRRPKYFTNEFGEGYQSNLAPRLEPAFVYQTNRGKLIWMR